MNRDVTNCQADVLVIGKMRNCRMGNEESKMRNRKLWKWMRNSGLNVECGKQNEVSAGTVPYPLLKTLQLRYRGLCSSHSWRHLFCRGSTTDVRHWPVCRVSCRQTPVGSECCSAADLQCQSTSPHHAAPPQSSLAACS